VALLISTLIAPLIWNAIQGAIRFSEATIWQVQLQRDLDRLTTLLDNDAADACLFGTTAVSNSCDVDIPTCAAASDQLRMRVTLLDSNDRPTGADAVIIYRRDATTNELRRTGPLILPNGQLDSSNLTSVDQLVMRGVSVFAVSADNSCNTATIQLTVLPVAASTFQAEQGLSSPLNRSLGLRTGSRQFVN